MQQQFTIGTSGLVFERKGADPSAPINDAAHDGMCPAPIRLQGHRKPRPRDLANSPMICVGHKSGRTLGSVRRMVCRSTEFCHTGVHPSSPCVDICMYRDVEESMLCNQGGGGGGEVDIPYDSARSRFKHRTVGIPCCFVGSTYLCDVSSGLNPVA